MKMHNECFPCLVKGTLNTARLATSDDGVQLDILQTVLERLATLDSASPPPLTAWFIQETIQAWTGVTDPYAALKKKYNDLALDLYPWLSSLKAEPGRDRFDTGVRLAVAGNIIDFGVAETVGENRLMTTISQALSMPVKGSMTRLRQAIEEADKILWLGDNAGEIVFDRLMLEEMDCQKVTYVVRGGPIQNDAAMADARDTGLTEVVQVIDSGAKIPGTILAQCSRELNQLYTAADLIIAKGQGNFETLAHDDSRIFFLFKAKCPVVARQAQCCLGDVVVRGLDSDLVCSQ
jgi:uncharacterized protein with ATP-grasp and redox domains